MLDVDGSGSLDIEEFCDGITKMTTSGRMLGLVRFGLASAPQSVCTFTKMLSMSSSGPNFQSHELKKLHLDMTLC